MGNGKCILGTRTDCGIPTLQFKEGCVIPESDSLTAIGSRFHISTLLELIPWYRNL